MTVLRPLDRHVSLVRPLLFSARSDCEDLCRASGVTWREDASNRDVTKVRARLRRDVLPALNELWPGTARRIASTARQMAEIAALIDEQAIKAFGAGANLRWSRRSLDELPAIVLTTGLRRCAMTLNPAIADQLQSGHLADAAEAIQADDDHPKHFDWPGALVLRVTSKTVELSRKKPGDVKRRGSI
jgi:tRNA(Ile)-lysidine synthase TilS/MesJ